ncbi:CCR4-NOT transcription complex subunit 10 [Linum grandiflorum]
MLIPLITLFSLHQSSLCNDVLLYLEKSFGINSVSQGDNGSVAQQQSTNLIAKSSSIPNSSLVDAHSSDLAVSGNALESSLSRSLSLSEDSLEYESMFSLDISGQSLSKPPGFSSSTDLSRTSGDRATSTLDLKLKLQLYKVQFLLLTRNLKHAKREVKLAMNIGRGRDSSMALLLKSQLEYARGNHRKAIKLLMASSNRTEMGISNMLNNLGCIYYQLGNYHTSSVLFSKALNSCSSFRKDKPLKLLSLSQDKSLLIVYNCGVQHLACGKPLLAARCFQEAGLLFYNRPILWLRLAECCIMALQKGLIKGSRAASRKSEILVHVVGKGKWRHLAVKDGISRNGYVDSAEKDVPSQGDGQPELSMSFARQCLLNALHLLDYSELNHLKYGLPSSFSMEESESSDAVKNSNHKILTGSVQMNANGDGREQKGGVTSQEIMQNSISYYEDVHRRENQMIKQALLADLAYVELELENPEKALASAMSLFELPECSRIFVFLGHLYAAESLCLLNKPKEAADHVSVYLSGGDNMELPFKLEDFEQLQVEKTLDSEESNGGALSAQNKSVAFLKPNEALGTLYADNAALYAMQGEVELAQRFVTQALSLIPNSRDATLTAVYLDILLGKLASAAARLRQCNQVVFVSESVRFSRS